MVTRVEGTQSPLAAEGVGQTALSRLQAALAEAERDPEKRRRLLRAVGAEELAATAARACEAVSAEAPKVDSVGFLRFALSLMKNEDLSPYLENGAPPLRARRARDRPGRSAAAAEGAGRGERGRPKRGIGSEDGLRTPIDHRPRRRASSAPRPARCACAGRCCRSPTRRGDRRLRARPGGARRRDRLDRRHRARARRAPASRCARSRTSRASPR